MLEVKGFKVRRIGDMAGCYVVVGINGKGEEGEFFSTPSRWVKWAAVYAEPPRG
jgi:hypothetical protein